MKRLFIAAVIMLTPVVLLAADWPRFRGPQGNGFSKEKLTLLAKPKKLWSKDVGRGNAALVVSKGRAYTVGVQNGNVALQCLDAKTGRAIWHKKVHSGGADSSPSLVDGKIYLLCHLEKPMLRCFRATDGKLNWERELPSTTKAPPYGHAGSPLLWDDLIIVNVGRGTAVNHKTGKIVWQHTGLPGLATPVLFRDSKTRRPSVLIFAGAELIARDARSGRELWSLPWKTNLAVNAADPIYHDGKVFISTSYGKHAAVFDISTGRPEQVWKTSGSSFSSGFLWKNHVFCITGGGWFGCYDFHTGKRKWMHHGAGNGSAIVAGDKMILLSDRGRMWIAPLSAEKFNPVMQEQIHQGTTWTPPSLVDGRLYVRNKEGQVVCVQIARERSR